MKIKKMLPVFAVAIGLVLAMATSSFKEAPKAGQNQFFYEYVGTDFSQNNIQEPGNYIRATGSCSGFDDVCGVFLTTDQGLGNPADASDFSSEKQSLLASQKNHIAADDNISMQH